MTFHVTALPQPGETVTSGGLSVSAGGKSANQAAAAARLGASAGLLAAVAEDEDGRNLLRSLVGAGVDVTRVRRMPGLSTGRAFICLDSRGQNTIVVDPGANASLDPAGLQPSDFTTAEAVILCNETPAAVVRRAAILGNGAGATVIFNPSPWRELEPETVKHLDVLIVNEEEYFRATGARSVDGACLQQAHQALGVETLIVTLGAAGAVAVSGSESNPPMVYRVPAPQVTALDTAGCGDAFLGAFAVARTRGSRLGDALQFAVAVGAFVATGAGAQSSFPTLADLDHFVSEFMPGAGVVKSMLKTSRSKSERGSFVSASSSRPSK